MATSSIKDPTQREPTISFRRDAVAVLREFGLAHYELGMHVVRDPDATSAAFAQERRRIESSAKELLAALFGSEPEPEELAGVTILACAAGLPEFD